METISHRELRNQSGRVLEDVRNGAVIAVTNHGEVSAVLVPPHLSPIDRLIATGRLQRAAATAPLGLAVRRRITETTQSVLDEIRGDR
ncbi:MAG: type II toxin-antitoxin system prevent-host-death family antitoxin [Actinobacteria bacterium]|nr:type II toxin-antitoxin system prevent-host-death family antitoxin [Actinomycetota bacterium]